MKSIMTSYCSSLPLAIQCPLNKVCWRCVVLAIYDRGRCHTIARHTCKLSPHLKFKLELTLLLLNPEIALVLLDHFLKALDPDQLVPFRSHLIRILKIQVSAEQDKIWEKCNT